MFFHLTNFRSPSLYFYPRKAHFKENGELPATETDEFFHKLAEAYKFAYGKRSLLGDRFYQPDRDEFEELISNLTSFEYARRFYEKIEGQGLSFENI